MSASRAPLHVRLAGRLVALVCDAEDRHMLATDLEQEYRERRAVEGPWRASRWHLSQVARSLPPLVAYRLRRRSVPAGVFTYAAKCAHQLWLAARRLRREPGFTLLAGATLAVGIGASATAFTAFHAALLRPLPYETQDRLVVLSETRRGDEISVSYPDFADWRSRSASFEAMAAFRSRAATLNDGGRAERVLGQIVTADLSAVLGVRPLIGRPFGADADDPGATAEVILGYGLWQRRYGGNDGIVGRTVQIDGTSFDVIGVMPKGFDFPGGIVYGPAEIYFSFGTFWDADLGNRGSHPGLEVVGLRRPGVTVEQARQELLGLAAQIRLEHPDTNRDISVLVRDAVTVIVGDFREQLKAVSSASLVLLFIAGANVGGLTLARAMSRRRELAVRTALGANNASLIATLLSEHLVLAATGTAGGVGVAYGLTAAARRFVADLPRLADLEPDVAVLGFAAAAMMTTTLLFSIAPVVWLRGAALDPYLRQRGEARRGWRLRGVLVAAQFALALTLLAGASMLAVSLGQLERRTGGIVADDVLTFDLALPARAYTPAAMSSFYERLYAQLLTGPGVSAVGGISVLPFSGGGWQSGIRPFRGPEAQQVRTDVSIVTRDYFRAIGMRLIRGRAFDDRDTATSVPVAIVDERFAQRFWPGRNPIGQHVSGWGFDNLEVVGVVNHVDNYGVAQLSREQLYVSATHRPTPRLFTVLRSDADSSTVMAFARAAVHDLDPALAISSVRTMTGVVDGTIAGPKLAAVLAGGFSAIAVLLAAVGVYGLVAYSVELRRRETGIRLALGATPRSVVRLMVLSTTAALMCGTLAGLAGAFAAGRLLREQLFNVPPYKPSVVAASTAVLVATALAASWLPARRAARVPPAMVFQDE